MVASAIARAKMKALMLLLLFLIRNLVREHQREIVENEFQPVVNKDLTIQEMFSLMSATDMTIFKILALERMSMDIAKCVRDYFEDLNDVIEELNDGNSILHEKIKQCILSMLPEPPSDEFDVNIHSDSVELKMMKFDFQKFKSFLTREDRLIEKVSHIILEYMKLERLEKTETTCPPSLEITTTATDVLNSTIEEQMESQ